jgi:methionyl-tRNA synthetase
VWRTVARGNEFVDRQAPWKLAKDPALAADLNNTLAALVRQLARNAIHLFPFMPERMTTLWSQLDCRAGRESISQQPVLNAFDIDVAGWQVAKGAPLFPKAVTAS